MPPDTRKIYVYVNTGFSGAKHQDWYDLPDGWDDWDESTREYYLRDAADTEVANHIDAGAYVVGGKGETEALEDADED